MIGHARFRDYAIQSLSIVFGSSEKNKRTRKDYLLISINVIKIILEHHIVFII